MRSETRTAYGLLAIAIILEVAGTLSLRLSDGFTHVGWTAVAIAGYGTSIFLFGQALVRGMNLGVGYGTLTGVGLAAAALASAVLFAEGISALQVLALVSLLAGVVLLQPRTSGS
ncbi:MAG: SMR family transporter [Ornithinibacter sp.]